MRTNIEIDDELLERARRAGGTATKRATVELALRVLAERVERRATLDLAGTVQWHGDLDASRAGR